MALSPMQKAAAQTGQPAQGNQQTTQQAQVQADTTDLNPINKGVLSVKKTSDGKYIIKTEGISGDRSFARQISSQAASAEAMAQEKTHSMSVSIKPVNSDTFLEGNKYIVEGEWEITLIPK